MTRPGPRLMLRVCIRVGRRLVVQSEEEGGGGGVVRTKNIAIMATRGGGKADDLAAEGR